MGKFKDLNEDLRSNIQRHRLRHASLTFGQRGKQTWEQDKKRRWRGRET